MDEKIVDKIINYIDGIERRLGNVEGFAASEVPLYVQELLAYNFYFHLLISVTLLITAGIILFYGLKVRRNVDESDRPLATFTFGIGFLLTAFLSVASASELAKITIAPRVYIVDYFTNQLKVEK